MDNYASPSNIYPFRSPIKPFLSGRTNLDKDKTSALKAVNFPLRTVAATLSTLHIVIPVTEFKNLFPHCVEIAGEHFLPPTLEDLFAALGPDLRHITLNGAYFVAKGGATPLTLREVEGDTPLESLANLYLAIHE